MKQLIIIKKLPKIKKFKNILQMLENFSNGRMHSRIRRLACGKKQGRAYVGVARFIFRLSN